MFHLRTKWNIRGPCAVVHFFCFLEIMHCTFSCGLCRYRTVAAILHIVKLWFCHQCVMLESYIYPSSNILGTMLLFFFILFVSLFSLQRSAFGPFPPVDQRARRGQLACAHWRGEAAAHALEKTHFTLMYISRIKKLPCWLPHVRSAFLGYDLAVLVQITKLVF